MIWLTAAGAIPAAALFYGLGNATPDPPRWLILSALVSLGMIWLAIRKNDAQA